MNGIWKEILQILLGIKFENKEKYEKNLPPGGFETDLQPSHSTIWANVELIK